MQTLCQARRYQRRDNCICVSLSPVTETPEWFAFATALSHRRVKTIPKFRSALGAWTPSGARRGCSLARVCACVRVCVGGEGVRTVGGAGEKWVRNILIDHSLWNLIACLGMFVNSLPVDYP